MRKITESIVGRSPNPTQRGRNCSKTLQLMYVWARVTPTTESYLLGLACGLKIRYILDFISMKQQRKIRKLGQRSLKIKSQTLWRTDHNQQEWVPRVEKERNASLRMEWLCSSFTLFFLCSFVPTLLPSTTSSGKKGMNLRQKKFK